MIEKDLFAKALYDYWHQHHPEDLLTWTNLTSKEVLHVSYLFRDFDLMPETEQLALSLANGSILDVGAGSGIHTLYLQQQKKDVTALEISPLSCQLMKERGVKKVIQSDFFNFSGQKFHTILFLMNGIGLVEKAVYTDRLFQKLDELLFPDGQAIIHSSDLKYLYKTASGYQIPKEGYYGDVRFFISYKNEVEGFDWTYIDEETLDFFAVQNGFVTQKLIESEHGDFLLKVTRKK